MAEFDVADSLVQGLICAYSGRTLPAHGSNFGQMPFPPTTHMGSGGS